MDSDAINTLRQRENEYHEVMNKQDGHVNMEQLKTMRENIQKDVIYIQLKRHEQKINFFNKLAQLGVHQYQLQSLYNEFEIFYDVSIPCRNFNRLLVKYFTRQYDNSDTQYYASMLYIVTFDQQYLYDHNQILDFLRVATFQNNTCMFLQRIFNYELITPTTLIFQLNTPQIMRYWAISKGPNNIVLNSNIINQYKTLLLHHLQVINQMKSENAFPKTANKLSMMDKMFPLIDIAMVYLFKAIDHNHYISMLQAYSFIDMSLFEETFYQDYLNIDISRRIIKIQKQVARVVYKNFKTLIEKLDTQSSQQQQELYLTALNRSAVMLKMSQFNTIINITIKKKIATSKPLVKIIIKKLKSMNIYQNKEMVSKLFQNFANPIIQKKKQLSSDFRSFFIIILASELITNTSKLQKYQNYQFDHKSKAELHSLVIYYYQTHKKQLKVRQRYVLQKIMQNEYFTFQHHHHSKFVMEPFNPFESSQKQSNNQSKSNQSNKNNNPINNKQNKLKSNKKYSSRKQQSKDKQKLIEFKHIDYEPNINQSKFHQFNSDMLTDFQDEFKYIQNIQNILQNLFVISKKKEIVISNDKTFIISQTINPSQLYLILSTIFKIFQKHSKRLSQYHILLILNTLFIQARWQLLKIPEFIKINKLLLKDYIEIQLIKHFYSYKINKYQLATEQTAKLNQLIEIMILSYQNDPIIEYNLAKSIEKLQQFQILMSKFQKLPLLSKLQIQADNGKKCLMFQLIVKFNSLSYNVYKVGVQQEEYLLQEQSFQNYLYEKQNYQGFQELISEMMTHRDYSFDSFTL